MTLHRSFTRSIPNSGPSTDTGPVTNAHVLVLERALAEIDFPRPDPGRWTEQLVELASQLRMVLSLHLGIITFPTIPLAGGSRTLQCHESVLAIMRAGGVSDSRSVSGFYLFWLIVNGCSTEETRPSLSDAELMSQHFASLPADRYPNLSAIGLKIADAYHDVLFDQLMRLLIDGLAGSRDVPSPRAPKGWEG